jgi:hypothetical protein
MTERAHDLSATADRQMSTLIELLSTLEHSTLKRPCPGRQKLGDGTIGAAVQHTADNYQRIAAFVQTSDRMSATHQPAGHGTHRIPRLLRALGHRSEGHAPHDHSADVHDNAYTAEIDVNAVVEQLSASRSMLARIVEFTDIQLDAIPPKDSFRFCDGRRTLEKVLAGLLRHQGHQIDAITAAVA